MLEWTDSYLVNIPEIDNQHKVLFKLYNRVAELYSKDSKDEEGLKDLLNRLANYAFRHFETEEKYLHSVNYPKFTLHRSIHQQFRKKIATFSAMKEVNNTYAELLDYIGNWIKYHILDEDFQYSIYLKKKSTTRKL